MCVISDYLRDRSQQLGLDPNYFHDESPMILNESKLLTALLLDNKFLQKANEELTPIQFNALLNLKNMYMKEPVKGKAMSLLDMKKMISQNPDLVNPMYFNAWQRVLVPMNEQEYQLSEDIYRVLEDDMRKQIDQVIKKYKKDPHNSQLQNDLDDIRETSMVAVATKFNGQNYTYIIVYYTGLTEKNNIEDIEDFEDSIL